MIHDRLSSLKGFALLLYVAVTLVALVLLCSCGAAGIIAGTINTAANSYVTWQAYKKFNPRT